MRAKEDAKNAKPQQPIVRPGANADADADTERPAVPVAKGKSGGSSSSEEGEMEEIPIAGRTKMTVPKMKDQGVVQGAVQGGAQAETEEAVVDHTEAKSELNDILKRSPSMLFPAGFHGPLRVGRLTSSLLSSNHLFEIVLSLQQKGQDDSAGAIRYFAEAVCCRVGSAPDWIEIAGLVGA
jgi:hypothetical protein